MLRLDVIAPGARGILARRTSKVGLGDASGDFVASYQANLQSRVNALGPQAAAALQAETGVDVNQARVAQGAAAALSLAQNGFDPSSQQDEQELVAAVAGALCLVPVVGPALGACLEVMYQVFNAASCPLEHAFASIGLIPDLPPGCGGPPCTSSGNWTTAGILSANAGQLPTLRDGTFAKLTVSALAHGAAQAANCKTSVPPGILVDAIVRIWNQTHAGPAAQILVPPLQQTNKGIVAFGRPTLLTTWQNVSGGGGLAAQAGKDPYAYYAFGRVIDMDPADNANMSGLPSGAGPWTPWPVAPNPPLLTSTSGNLTSDWTDAPRVVLVNMGPPIAQDTSQTSAAAAAAAAAAFQAAQSQAEFDAATAAASQPPSTAKTVAVAAVSAVSAVALGGTLWALVQKQAVGYFWGKVFDKVVDGAKGVLRG